MQKLKLARYGNMEALVKAAEVPPPKTPPAIEVCRAARLVMLLLKLS